METSVLSASSHLQPAPLSSILAPLNLWDQKLHVGSK